MAQHAAEAHVAALQGQVRGAHARQAHPHARADRRRVISGWNELGVAAPVERSTTRPEIDPVPASRVPTGTTISIERSKSPCRRWRAASVAQGVVLQQVNLERYGRMGHGSSAYYYHYGRHGKYYSA